MKAVKEQPVNIFITSAQAGNLLRVSPATLCRWRKSGRGPRAHRIGPGSYRYLQADVDAWLATCALRGPDA